MLTEKQAKVLKDYDDRWFSEASFTSIFAVKYPIYKYNEENDIFEKYDGLGTNEEAIKTNLTNIKAIGEMLKIMKDKGFGNGY